MKKTETKDKKENLQAIDDLKSVGVEVTRKNILKMRLLKQQRGNCLYTGDPLCATNIKQYEIDHIFPSDCNGPDAMYNKVVTTSNFNGEKGKHLPYECEKIRKQWKAYVGRVKNRKLSLDKKKKQLLTVTSHEEANELVEKYIGLAGTAYIARLARDIVCLEFGWQIGEKDVNQKVFVFSGGFTSKVARDRGVYKLLGDGDRDIKNRDDYRHHAVDAMILSYLPHSPREIVLPENYYKNFEKQNNYCISHYVTKTKATLSEKPEETKVRKKHNIDNYKNISKASDEQAHYYTNFKEQGTGTLRHGVIFYYENEKWKDEVINSFDSTHYVTKSKKQIADNNRIWGPYSPGVTVSIKEKFEATKLGTEVLGKIDQGEYCIEKINKNDVTISSINNDKYKLKKRNIRQIIIREHLNQGDEF